jgi:hypothetical protein
MSVLPDPRKLSRTTSPRFVQSRMVLGIAITFGWLSAAYGAYRHLFGLTRGRSTLVAIVTLALLVPTYFLALWITAASRALFGADI